MSQLIEFLEAVPGKRWCTAKWCTTCGHRHFAAALVRLEQPPEITIESMMSEVPFGQFQRLPDWSDYLVSIFNRRRGPMQPGLLSSQERERVLLRWLERLIAGEQADVSFADHVLFHPLRSQRSSSCAVLPWFNYGISLLRASRDHSLGETMVYFGGRHPQYQSQILKVLDELNLETVAIQHAFTQVKYT